MIPLIQLAKFDLLLLQEPHAKRWGVKLPMDADLYANHSRSLRVIHDVWQIDRSAALFTFAVASIAQVVVYLIGEILPQTEAGLSGASMKHPGDEAVEQPRLRRA